MNKNFRNIKIIFVLLFLLLHFYIKYSTRENHEFGGAKQGEEIGSFQGNSLDGSTLDLSERVKKNKLVAINFWETWCGPCREELPYLQKIYAQNKNDGFEIIGIFHDSKIEAVNEMIKEHSLSFPMLHDKDNSISRQFKIIGLPTTIVVDSNMKILRSTEGIDTGLDDFVTFYLKNKKL